MFSPKLGSPGGATISYDQVLGLLIGIAASDQRKVPFSDFEVPEKLESEIRLVPPSRSLNTIAFPIKRRRTQKPKIDPLNPDYEDIDEADEGVPKTMAIKSSDNVPPKPSSKYLRASTGGSWSDKTQLSIAVMNSIAEAHGIEISAIVEEHVNALSDALEDNSFHSWPKTTLSSIQSIALSNSTSEYEEREREFLEKNAIIPPARASITYFTSGNDECLGDGYLPKLAPVAMYYATRSLSDFSVNRKHWELQRIIAITHTHPLANVCGMVFVAFLERLLRMEVLEDMGDYVLRQLILMELFSYAVELEDEFGETEGHLSKGLSWVISNTETLEVEDLKKRCVHSSRLCLNALLWTLGLFLIEGVSMEAIAHTESFGTSTDARLSMIMLTFGSLFGRKRISGPYVDRIPHLSYLLDTARDFHATLPLKTETLPKDVEPAETLEYIENNDSLVWAAPYRPNGPLIAEAFGVQSKWEQVVSYANRFWRLTGLKDFFIWLTEPSPFKLSALLMGINYLAYLGATAFINHGKFITAPQPPAHEYALHERYYPVLLPSKGGETRAYKDTQNGNSNNL